MARVYSNMVNRGDRVRGIQLLDSAVALDTGFASAYRVIAIAYGDMPSAPARLFNVLIRAIVRRRNWGDARRLTRRARRLLGGPRMYGRLLAVGLKRRDQRAAGVAGEWLEPPGARPGVILYVHGMRTADGRNPPNDQNEFLA